jgi:pilus assembly protein CpaC
LLGKLFQSRSVQKNNSELLVLVTPELVRPLGAGDPKPEIKMPGDFLKGAAMSLPANPKAEIKESRPTVPVELLQPIATAPEPPAAPVNDPMVGKH